MTKARIRVLILMLADIACMASVLALVLWFYKAIGVGEYDLSSYLAAWPMLPAYVVINIFFRLYHGNPFYPSLPLSPIEEFRRLIGSSFVVYMIAMAVLGFRHEANIVSRFVLIASALLTAVAAQPVRDFVRRLMRRHDFGRIPALVVGPKATAEHLVKRLKENSIVGFDPVLFEGDNHDIVSFAKARDIKILITCQDHRLVREEMVDLVKWFQHVIYMPEREIFPILGSHPISVDGIGGLEMVNQRRIKGYMLEKRLVDSLLSIMIGLVALPFLLVMPILIKLTSNGPILYKAKRLGKGGSMIYVWKFRSMYQDADQRLQSILESDPVLKAEFECDFKLKNDPRVTPLGRFMRKTSIDELPQLWNVIRGEMALVGPRPIVEKEIAYYGADYEIFSLVKPGITGLWQATGRSDNDYKTRVALDKFYVMNWSPWMDLWIVIRTAVAVLGMKGSY